jgi:cyclophilin family peptidyl-prolyl cis-trans isomerase/HEAT repeat protein
VKPVRASLISVAPLALVLAVACGAPALPEPATAPPPAVSRPAIDDASVSALAELLRAEDRRTLDPARIEQLLQHPLHEVRERAALAAGRIGDARASALLLRALDDSAVDVGASAAFGLGLLRDTASTVVYALVRKVGVTWSEEDRRAVEAVAAFGRIGTPAAHAALRQVLQRYAPVGTASPGEGGGSIAIGATGKEALLAIWRIARPETAVDLVLPHLASADDDVRWRAAYALGRMGSARTAEPMLGRLGDPSPLVRALAARALRAPVADSARLRPRVTVALVAALADPHPHVQINAAGALATYADSTLAGALDVVLASADANVRLAAVQALGNFGGDPAAGSLARIAQDPGERLVVRNAALAALLRQAPARGLAEAARWAADENWLARLYAARALGTVGWTDSGRHLRRLAEDADGRVAAAAIRAATATTDTLTAPYGLYVQALASGHAGVRAAATAGMARRASAADVAVLMQAYERAQRDTANHAALAAVDALGALQQRGVPISRAFFLRFQAPADRELRARVARLLGDGWGVDTTRTAANRPLSFYEGVVRELMLPDLIDGRRPRAVIRTVAGSFVIELAPALAPLTVLNFVTLATNGYYPRSADGNGGSFRWHRVVPNFVLQDGDPGDDRGGPGYRIRDEINRLRYERGMVGMALSGPDTGGSQYFITHSPQPHLDGGYTIFGRVVSGMEVADRVVQDDAIFAVEIER